MKYIRILTLLLAAASNLSALSPNLLIDSQADNFNNWTYPYGLSSTDLRAAQSLFLYAYALYDNPDISLGPGQYAHDVQIARIRKLLVYEPSCVGGIFGWNDGRIAHSLLLAQRTPAIWDALTVEEKEKVDWLMRALAIAGHFCMDDGNNFHQMLHGDGNFQKTWNPNHVEGYVGAVIAASLYFGPDALNTIYKEFDFDPYIAKFTELGFMNIVAAWTATPETKGLMMDGGNSVSNPDVNSTWGGWTGSGLGVRNEFTYKGEPLDNPFGIYYYLGDRMYSHVVVSTVDNPSGEEIKILGEATGAIISPYEGQVGMLYEFLSGDAEGLRSDPGYCFDGLINNIPNRVIVQLLGGWPDSPEGRDLRERTDVGVGDFIFKVTEGYQGFQHGHTNIVRKSDLLDRGYESVIALYEEMRDFTPAITAPVSPVSLSASLNDAGIQLEWTDASDNETGFEIFRSTTDGDFRLIGRVGADETTFTDPSPRKGASNAYRVRAAGEDAFSFMSDLASVFIPNLESSVIDLQPTDDSFIRGGTYGDDNYGSGQDLLIKDAVGLDYERTSLLKFDLSGIEGPIFRASLNLVTSTYDETTLALSALSDDSWMEDTITANTLPDWGEVVTRFDVLEGENFVDVTDYILAEQAGDDFASFILHGENDADIFVSFGSSESAQPPILSLEMYAQADYLLPATDGTFVQAGANSAKNYGTELNLIVKDAGGIDFDRTALLQFSVQDFVGKSINSAVLNLESSSYAPASLVLRSIADDAWSEAEVTLDTTPELGGVIARFDVVEGTSQIDITDYVAAQLTSDGLVSLAIQDEDNADIFLAFHSDDSPNPPMLALTVLEEPVYLPWEAWGLRSGDIIHNPWFGRFELAEGGWIRHAEFGWISVSQVTDATDMWLYSLILDSWVWSNDAIFPLLYDHASSSWIYYFYLEDVGGWIFDYSTNSWSPLG